jgi:PPOX class probable F420-dependent enzyme
MLTQLQRRFLDGTRVGRLATADARAEPHVVPVCFAVGGDALYITIDRKPKGDPRKLKRLRNITGNPIAAFVADFYDEDWTRLGWVMIRGRTEILEGGEEHDNAQRLLRTRYPQYLAMAIDDLPVIAVRIERVTSWGSLPVNA